MTFIPFPEIGQFRSAIHKVRHKAQEVTPATESSEAVLDLTIAPPTLAFEGTVKLHGTNAAIGLDRVSDEVWYQSRERLVTYASDNAGFASHFITKDVRQLFGHLGGNVIVIFGEWCGGGIQKGIGLTGLTKRFVVFAVMIDGKFASKDVVKQIKNESLNVFNIYDYLTVQIEIDFAKPEDVQNKLVELTLAVEDECPVAKSMGSIGIGEGIVWKGITPGWESSDYWFKVKGEKHAGKGSSPKFLAPIDAVAVAGAKEFASLVCTEGRLRQGIDKLKEQNLPTERSSLGKFLQWVVADVVKEEMDIAIKNGVDWKKSESAIIDISRKWFFEHELEF